MAPLAPTMSKSIRLPRPHFSYKYWTGPDSCKSSCRSWRHRRRGPLVRTCRWPCHMTHWGQTLGPGSRGRAGLREDAPWSILGRGSMAANKNRIWWIKLWTFHEQFQDQISCFNYNYGKYLNAIITKIYHIYVLTCHALSLGNSIQQNWTFF